MTLLTLDHGSIATIANQGQRKTPTALALQRIEISFLKYLHSAVGEVGPQAETPPGADNSSLSCGVHDIFTVAGFLVHPLTKFRERQSCTVNILRELLYDMRE
jgi:hypothetical protein